VCLGLCVLLVAELGIERGGDRDRYGGFGGMT